MSSAPQSASPDGFERTTIDGTEYLVNDVVAQKEGVYTYPDPSGGVRREYISADQLIEASEGVDSLPILLEHPTTSDGSLTLTSDPRANYEEVGMWSDLRATDSEDGIAGKVYIRANELDEHDGELRRYKNRVERFGPGEVSTGYDLDHAVLDPGRFNGMKYTHRQVGPEFDHLALLVDEQGDCSVEDGCGLGRANVEDSVRLNNHIPQEREFSMDGPFRFNQSVEYKATTEEVTSNTSFTDSSWDAQSVTSSLPDPSEDEGAGEVLDAVHAASPKGEEARQSKSNWKLPYKSGPDAPINTRALTQIDSILSGGRGGVKGVSSGVQDRIESWAQRALNKAPDDKFGAGEDRENIVAAARRAVSEVIGMISPPEGQDSRTRKTQMEDSEKVNELVEEHGFTQDNLEPLDGTECLNRIHESFTEENPGNSPMGNNGNKDDPEDDEFSEEQIERINEVVEETVEESVPSPEEIAAEVETPNLDDIDIDADELADKLAEDVTEEVEERQEFEENVETIAESDELPHIDEERANQMGEDLAAELAEEVQESESEESGESRANRVGVEVGSSFDPADYDGESDFDISPAGAGAPGTETEQESDD